MMMYVQKEAAEKLSLAAVANEFAAKGEKRRQDFVEKSSFLCVVYLWISPHFRGHYVNVGLEHKIKRRSGR